jgi:hypothetical protein
MGTKGNSMGHDHGNSFANGKDTFRMPWEQRHLAESQASSYDSDEPSPKAA